MRVREVRSGGERERWSLRESKGGIREREQKRERMREKERKKESADPGVTSWKRKLSDREINEKGGKTNKELSLDLEYETETSSHWSRPPQLQLLLWQRETALLVSYTASDTGTVTSQQ